MKFDTRLQTGLTPLIIQNNQAAVSRNTNSWTDLDFLSLQNDSL